MRIEYKIPDEIKKIPSYFYSAFAGELCSVFGLRIFEKDEDDIYNLYYVEGTYAWAEAFKMTCWKLDIKWLMDYYDSLEWCDSDLFDGEIENKLISEFVEAKGIEVDTYYQFLIKKLERGL